MPYTSRDIDTGATLRVMTAGLLLGALMTVPFYNWIYDKDWHWAEGFPLGWLGTGSIYMSTFFHEIGHTVLAWFYGYVTLPSFDFKHGGGMAWSFGEQNYIIIAFVYGLIFYGLHYCRESVILCAALGGLFVFHLLTAYNDLHRSVIDFMGPAFEPLIAGFFLTRAWLDKAPRGGFERFLNALFGFSMIFHVFVESYALRSDSAYRTVYYEQKGSHGFGDFDKIAERLSFLDFNGVVTVWSVLAVLCLLIPIGLYLKK